MTYELNLTRHPLSLPLTKMTLVSSVEMKEPTYFLHKMTSFKFGIQLLLKCVGLTTNKGHPLIMVTRKSQALVLVLLLFCTLGLRLVSQRTHASHFFIILCYYLPLVYRISLFFIIS